MSQLQFWWNESPTPTRGFRFAAAPSGGYIGGHFYKHDANSIWGVAYDDYAEGVPGVIVFFCDSGKLLTNGAVIAAGDPVYLDTSTGFISATQGTGHIMVGVAVKASGATDDYAVCRLDTTLGVTAVGA